jgi:ATP-binding cassette subfamily C protein CydC
LTLFGVARLAAAAVAAALCEASAVGLVATAAWLICRAAQQPPLSALMVAIVLVRALAIGRGGFRYVERLAGHDAVLRIMAQLRGKFFDALIPLAPSGLTAFRRGDLLSRLVSDVDAVQDLLLRLALPAFAAFAVGGATTIWVLSVQSSAGLALAFGLVLAILVLPACAALLTHRVGGRLAVAKTELAARTVDLVEGVEDLLLSDAREAVERREWAAALNVARLERRRGRHRAAVAAAGTFVQLGTCVAVGWYAATGGLDSVAVAVLVLVTLAVLEVALPLLTAAERLGALFASVRRVRAVLQLKVDDEPTVPTNAPEGPIALGLNGITLTYAGADRPALSNVSVNVPAGARVALVGPSGSGKSSILALALRLIRPNKGTVELSGTNIDALAGTDLRPGMVCGLTQDACLFTGSIQSNLRLANEHATDEELWAVLTRVGADEWIRELPGGLDTIVSGQGLSGGQRQRLVLAAALLANPAVLVLDEPTESLDMAGADAVLADAVAATVGRTVLLVSHRVSGLEAMDQVVVLDDGHVVQHGTHAELMGMPGFYRQQYLAEAAAAQRVA